MNIRRYRSEQRQAQAEQTRLAVLDAARDLFVDRGFEGTSITAIAAAANVSPETVYARFKTKRALLGEVAQRAVRGDDPKPVLEQAGFQKLVAARDQHDQLQVFAADISERLERAAPIVAVVAEAARANSELRDLLERLHADRSRNLGKLVSVLEQNGPLAIGSEQAIETVWALSSPELHETLRRVRGWTRGRYTNWLAESLARCILPA